MMDGQMQNEMQPYNTGAEKYTAGQSDTIVQLKLIEEDVIEDLEHSLKGETYDPKTGTFKVTSKKPLMNQSGAAYIVSVMRPLISKVMKLGYLEKDFVQTIAKEAENTVSKVIFVKHKEFDVDIAFATSIVVICGDQIMSTFSRAIDGFDQKQLGNTTRYSETFNSGQGRSSMFGFFKGGSGGAKW